LAPDVPLIVYIASC